MASPLPAANTIGFQGYLGRVLTFEWDEAKNAANLVKHGVTFEEASEIFSDPLSVTILDPEHSSEEDRFVTVGMSGTALLVVAIHTDRNGKIRIISARRARPTERRNYESI